MTTATPISLFDQKNWPESGAGNAICAAFHYFKFSNVTEFYSRAKRYRELRESEPEPLAAFVFRGTLYNGDEGMRALVDAFSRMADELSKEAAEMFSEAQGVKDKCNEIRLHLQLLSQNL